MLMCEETRPHTIDDVANWICGEEGYAGINQDEIDCLLSALEVRADDLDAQRRAEAVVGATVTLWDSQVAALNGMTGVIEAEEDDALVSVRLDYRSSQAVRFKDRAFRPRGSERTILVTGVYRGCCYQMPEATYQRSA